MSSGVPHAFFFSFFLFPIKTSQLHTFSSMLLSAAVWLGLTFTPDLSANWAFLFFPCAPAGRPGSRKPRQTSSISPTLKDTTLRLQPFIWTSRWKRACHSAQRRLCVLCVRVRYCVCNSKLSHCRLWVFFANQTLSLIKQMIVFVSCYTGKFLSKRRAASFNGGDLEIVCE